LVSVAKGAASGLGNADLVARLKERLASEDILGRELTEFLLRSHLAGEEGRGKAGTRSHLARVGGGSGGLGAWGSTRNGGIGLFLDRVRGSLAGSLEKDDDHNADHEGK
tara:strand:+ start:2196 stop:2522 length:327 start_codon:yes stop_codon:yes gene_type:complete